jgi:hypothetical protein
VDGDHAGARHAFLLCVDNFAAERTGGDLRGRGSRGQTHREEKQNKPSQTILHALDSLGQREKLSLADDVEVKGKTGHRTTNPGPQKAQTAKKKAGAHVTQPARF